MASTTVTVASTIGLHARPANIIADTVTDAGAQVTLALVGGEPVDAGSALMIMTLGAANGTDVVVTSDDPHALELVAKLVATDLDA
ncbi:HPr family phosphocarrier protein [Nocardia sp. CA-107356]|uniref:HPr family phosphocarrier protein n=1 Tax=Nocardia sp. CA-107356 TaxID=3239972 RepID=UPI003D92AC5B